MFALVLTSLLVMLLAAGYSGDVGSPSISSGGKSAAANGSVLDFSSVDVVELSPPARTVVLTFEDGPDETWTPRILDVLERHDAAGSFFVVGARAARHPEIVRRILSGGHDLGSHTFTHRRLDGVPGWKAALELNLTQAAITGVAGVRTAFLRPPGTTTPDRLTTADLDAARAAAAAGYVVVLSDVDSRDTELGSPASIAAAATPEEGEGAIVRFHDSGGDLSATVEALERLIPALRARGYDFATVSEVIGVAPEHSMAEAGPVERLQGQAVAWTFRTAPGVAQIVRLLALPVAVLVVLRTALLVILAGRHKRPSTVQQPGERRLVSVVVPAFNEEVGIEQTIRSIADNDYPDIEIVVVDDGSTDSTAERVESLGLENVVLIRRSNSGKANALNAGIARARAEVVVAIDGDTIFERDTISRLVRPLDDPRVGCVSGNVKVGNRKTVLGGWQHIEYVTTFNLNRRVLDLFECIPTVPGAVGAFRRRALEDVGGFSEDTLAEDTDVTMAINRAGWKVAYDETARAWTEAPATLSGLWRQRYRWAYGTLQCLWKHRGALRDRSKIGRALPYMFVFDVVVPVLSPAIDLYAFHGLMFGDAGTATLYWLLVAVVLQMAVGIYAFRLDGESLKPLWQLPISQFVQRQLMYLVVLEALRAAFLGIRLQWHKLARTGDVEIAGGKP